MLHKVGLTGEYRTTVYAVARRLLADGADPAVTVETYRGGKLSMTAIIGEAADKGGIHLARYKAFPSSALWPRTAETPSSAAMGHESRTGRAA